MAVDGLIYDLGLHRGEDTEFYLKKGFRVVAVDANPELCDLARETFHDAVAAGRLTIVNRAIALQEGTLTFYKNNVYSEWGTIDPDWAKRNHRMGAPSDTFLVEASSLSKLIDEFGPAYFVKIDIEGMDQIALQSLGTTTVRPKYISAESEKVSLAKLREEFDTFVGLGYNRFKIVPQHLVPRQRPPRPPREGDYADHRFAYGHSGLFGEEAPGRWLTAEEAISTYKSIFLRYLLVGDDPLINNRYLKSILRRSGFVAGWYDTHAKRAGN